MGLFWPASAATTHEPNLYWGTKWLQTCCSRMCCLYLLWATGRLSYYWRGECQSLVFLWHLQVKLLKCLVDNLVVDVSFNQLGGLCALNFLEEINRNLQPQHMLKKSIILVRIPLLPGSNSPWWGW